MARGGERDAEGPAVDLVQVIEGTSREEMTAEAVEEQRVMLDPEGREQTFPLAFGEAVTTDVERGGEGRELERAVRDDGSRRRGDGGKRNDALQEGQ